MNALLLWTHQMIVKYAKNMVIYILTIEKSKKYPTNIQLYDRLERNIYLRCA